MLLDNFFADLSVYMTGYTLPLISREAWGAALAAGGVKSVNGLLTGLIKSRNENETLSRQSAMASRLSD